MSAQVTILQLPAAGAITGTESVPIVQNGVTVQTTTGAIAAAPSQPYTYLTVNQTPQLPNSRYVGVTNGLVLTDAGAQGLFNISTTGALLSLVNSGAGIQVKTDATTLVNRSIAITGAGLGITNGDGIAGNPTLGLTGQVLNLANASFNGFMVLTSAGAITSTTLVGTANQIGITNTNGVGNPVFTIADDAIFPGTGAITVPIGTTGQRPSSPVSGMIRYDTTDGAYYGYATGAWRQFSLAGGVTLVNTGTGLTGGPITGVGTISLADTTVTAGAYGSSTEVGTFTVNAQGQLTAAANVAISASAIGAITTINGTPNEITATGASTVTLSLPAALTFTGKTITGGAYTGGSINSTTIGATTASSGAFTTLTASSSASVGGDTVATLNATQTLTNKSMSGSANTFTNIPNNALVNSQITLGTTNVALGGTALTIGGLTTVTVTQDPTSNFQLATKQYVDTLAASGIHYHEPVYVESPNTAGNLNATYNQPGGAGDGVGATLTNAGTQVALTIDGVLTTVGMRVLIYNQTNQVQNGVYTVTVVGDGSTNWVLTRATDADTYSPFSPNSLGQGDAFFVQAGATGAGETYICNTVGTIVFGVTNITFAQISSAQVYSAGTGLTLTGTVFSISNTAVTAGAYGSSTQVGTFTVNAQGQLTLAGNTTVTPAVGSITGLGTGVATALAINVGSAGAIVVNGGDLGTPSSGVVTNLTGTASININGTVGATTPATGAFTTISASGVITSTVVTGTAPFTVASTTTVANLGATNTVNTAVTADSTNATNYLTFVSATSGNLGQLVNSSITCNPSTGVLTGGISGGTF
jgi:trimeric autotransporter adhesin